MFVKADLTGPQGNAQAEDQLVLDNTGLVWSVVKKYRGRGYEQEDLFQIGCIGLMKAIDRFDQTFGVCFSTYAVPMIIGEIRRFLRDDGMIKVSRTVKETAVRARQLQAKYEAAYGIEPTVCQLASLMQIAPEELASALSSSQEVESLQKTIYQSDGNAILLEDRLESKENEQEKLVNRLALKKVMCELPDQEQKIIIMRYYSGQTQVQTAKCLGISQVQVSRIEKRDIKENEGAFGNVALRLDEKKRMAHTKYSRKIKKEQAAGGLFWQILYILK